jgi:hypothetical protein
MYLDLARHGPDAETAAGEPLVVRLFENAKQAHLQAIPVAGPLQEKQGKEGTYLKCVADISVRDGRGAAIRIPFPDLVAPDDLSEIIDQVQSAIALDDSLCDVILDAGPSDALPGGFASALSVLTETLSLALQAIEHRRFRALVVCASSIPQSAKTPNSDEPFRIANLEYQIWSQLLNSKAYRDVRFGDYGARYANQTDGKTFARPPARIHLSTGSKHTLFIDSHTPYRQLARRVSDSPEFTSQIGTWGKHAIRDAAQGGASEGSATDWVARDTHMHLEMMVRAVEDRIQEVSGPMSEEEQIQSFPHDQASLPL